MTPSMQQVFDLIDSIAGEWDGCEYEDAMIPDIGQAIRQAGRPRINALFLELSKAATGAQGDAKDAEGGEPKPVGYVPRCHTDGLDCIEGELRWDEVSETPFEVAHPENWQCLALYPPGYLAAMSPRGVMSLSDGVKGTPKMRRRLTSDGNGGMCIVTESDPDGGKGVNRG